MMRPRTLPELPPRRREVLHAVIREHIASARPVGSAELVRRYRLGVSSATVRNELAALEELGLLSHPHTSAGRMPTDLGYRYFIEALMPDPDLRQEERVTLSHQFRQAAPDAAEWLRLATSTLARLTAEAAIATYDRQLAAHEVTWSRVIHYEGVEQVLTQPEFREGERVRHVFTLLQDRQLLAQVLPGQLGPGDVAVSIGSEHAIEPLRPFSLVIGRYGEPGTMDGYVGVLGPTRMDYHRTIGAVRYIGALMSDLARAIHG